MRKVDRDLLRRVARDKRAAQREARVMGVGAELARRIRTIEGVEQAFADLRKRVVAE